MAGFFTWETGWSDDKIAWCCKHEGRGCKTTTTECAWDCNLGFHNWALGWSDLKKNYCCKHENKGCPTTTTDCVWDCNEGFHNWKNGWSVAKKDYCCKHEGKGCQLTTTTECAWDCNLGFHNWALGWSDLKKKYCCKHENKGCPTTTTDCVWDCNEGLHNWAKGWSVKKKEYCCKHEGKGCPTTTTDCVWDCDLGFHNWVLGWSDLKKAYCCKHERKGCPTTTTETTSTETTKTSTTPTTTMTNTKTDTTATTMTATTMTATSTSTISTTTTACPWDCGLGYHNWYLGWSVAKKQYCCKHFHKGCETTTSTMSTTTSTSSTMTTVTATSTATKTSTSTKTKTTTTFTLTKTSSTMTTVSTLPREPALSCDLFCFGNGARTVPLPGSEGSGEGAMILGLTRDQCHDACASSPTCDAVVYSNKTKGVRGGSMCIGKRDVHTDKCQPGGKFQTDLVRPTVKPPWGKCALFGDPHILGWDTIFGPVVTNLGLGEFYLVKHPELDIHARFGFTARFPTASSTVGIAVGGSLIMGHTLVVEYVGPELGYKGFKAFWDGQEILADYPSNYTSADKVLKARHDAMNPTQYHREGRHTIGGVDGLLPSYYFEMKPDVNIYVLIGPDNCNAVIQTKKLTGQQDGYCGNFNCNQDDDTMEEIKKRGLADPIPEQESLFRSGLKAPKASMTRTGPVPSLKNCKPDLKKKAEKACTGLPPAETDACVFDVCAAQSTVMASEDQAILVSDKEASSYHCDQKDADSWSDKKQKWCCDHAGLGCKETTTSPSAIQFRKKFETLSQQSHEMQPLAGLARPSIVLLSACALGAAGFFALRRTRGAAADARTQTFVLLDNELTNSIE